MDNALASFVEVNLNWATHHHWEPGRRPQQSTIAANKLWLMRRGSVQVTVNNRIYCVQSGMAFLVAAQHQRTWVENSRPTDFIGIGFQASLFRGPNLLSSLEAPELWKPSAREYSALEMWLLWLSGEDCFEKEEYTLRSGRALEANGLGQAIFGMCWRRLEARGLVSAPQQSMPQWILAALQYIRTAPDTSVAQWARATGFSPAQFRRLFGQWVGVSPQEYLARYRLDEARRLLAATDSPIGLVAQQVGFSNQSHFTRRFREQTGVTPAQYRSSLQENSSENF